MDIRPLLRDPDPSPPMRPYPSLLQAVWLLLVAIMLQAAIGTPFALVFEDEQGLMRTPSLWGLVNLLALGPVIAYAWRRAGGTLDLFRLRPVPAALVTPILLCVLGGAILVSELDNVTQTLIGPPPEALDFSWMFTGGLRQLLGLIFLLMIVAPATEELLFRGLILPGLLSRHGPAPAVTLTALLFALFHVNPWQLVGAFVLGLLFGWLYVACRSLVPCLMGHAAANGFPLLVSMAFPSIPGLTQLTDPVQFQPLWLDALGLVLVGSGGLWMRKALRMDFRADKE